MTQREIISRGDDPFRYGQSLPIQPPARPPITEMDYRKVAPPPLFKVNPACSPTRTALLTGRNAIATARRSSGLME